MSIVFFCFNPKQVIPAVLRFLLHPFERKACFSPQIPCKKTLDLKTGAEEIRVLLIGDTGSGSSEQRNIALASAKTCAELGCDLALMLGDNFIQHGVQGVDDPQFQEKFEAVYSHQLPFYAVLGNHDLRGDWQAQVEYTNYSKRWVMPDVNYRFIAGPVQFIGINTSCTVCSLWGLLSRRSTPWRLVFGHRPMKTQGRHRGMTLLEQAFIRMSDAQLYCCGHNHILEHIRIGKMDQITSGGGGSPLDGSGLSAKSHVEFIHEDHGYVWLHFQGHTMRALYFDKTGERIYQFERGL